MMFGKAIVAALFSAATVEAVVSVHGSGTTNPSKCYWTIMDLMQSQAKLPVHMTYRAVGSTTGQKEFVNDQDVASGANHFGSGDLPMTKDRFAELADADIEMAHLPVFTGAVTFFHNVEGVEDLNLTGTLLARMYMHEITDWDHPDILAENPNMELDSSADTTIHVKRRDSGSSSTAAATEFMHSTAGEDVFPEAFVDAMPEWTQNETTVDNLELCSGSSGMSSCVSTTPYSIGYIDWGHGKDAGLAEVRLQNLDGTWLTATESMENNGLESAEAGVLPATPFVDFSHVSLINREGEWTWPMTALTYIYVRKNLDIYTPEERGVLFYFLEALYTSEYIGVCEAEYDFILPSQEIVDFGLKAIEELKKANDDTVYWAYEGDDAEAIVGAQDYIFSVKRETPSLISDDDLTEALLQSDLALVNEAQTITDLEDRIESLEEALLAQTVELESLRSTFSQESESASQDVEETSLQASTTSATFGVDEEKQLRAAMILASISFTLWAVTFILAAARFFTKS